MDPKKKYFEVNASRQPATLHINYPGVIRGTKQIITTDYTVEISDAVIICNSALPITVYLRPATAQYSLITIASINTGLVTVVGSGSPAETIDDETEQYLDQWDSMSIIDYDTAKWKIL